MRNKFIVLLFVILSRSSFAQITDIKEIILSNNIENVQEIHFFSSDTVIVLGDLNNALNSYYYSTNSGTNWMFLSQNNFKTQFLTFQSIKNWYGTLTGANDFYYYSNDTGKTVEKFSIEMDISGKIQAHNEVLFATLGYNSIGSFNRSLDYGKTWFKIQDSFVCDLVYALDSNLIVKGYYKNSNKNTHDYWRSADFGKTWIGLCKMPEDSRGIDLPLNYVSLDTAYFTSISYTDNSITIYWSFDGGNNIYTQYTVNVGSQENLGNVKMVNSKIGYRLEGGTKLYKTYDGGQNWSYKYTFSCAVSTIEIIDKDNVYFHLIGGSSAVNKCIYVTHNGAEPIVSEEEEPKKSDFSLYPNPANQSITLQTPNALNAQLSIYNLMGQLQYNNPSQAPGSIDIGQLATGLYIFELRQGSALHRQRIEVVK